QRGVGVVDFHADVQQLWVDGRGQTAGVGGVRERALVLGGEAHGQLEPADTQQQRQECPAEPAREETAHPRAAMGLSRRSSTVTGRVSTRNPAISNRTRSSSGILAATVTTTGMPGATRSKSATCSRMVIRRDAASTTMSDTGSVSSVRTPSHTFSPNATATLRP